MKTFIRITVAIAILVSLGFTYMSAKEAKVLVESEINGDNIRANTYKLVRKMLEKPYNLKTTKEPNEIMFSRCPSGNRVGISEYATTENEYSYGEMGYYEGCVKNKVVCNFRARLSDNSVDILQSDSVSYIAADLWIEKAIVSETNGLDIELAEN